MVCRRSSRVATGLMGWGLVLGLPTIGLAQDRGDGQSSTRISEPLREGGLDQGRTVPRDDTSIDPGAIGAEPLGEGAIPNLPEPGGRRRLPGEDADLPEPGLDPELPPAGTPAAPGFTPIFPEDIPTALDPSFLGGGPDLTQSQRESLRSSEDRLLPAARSISDPAQRSLALNRIALSKISSGRYDEARSAVEEASAAALSMPRGLLRDLRLIAIYRTYVEMAHDRVVEAVPTISPIGPLLPQGDDEPEADRRGDFLKLSEEEYARAADLVGAIDNKKYRNEHLASVVQAQAIDSMKICNDASRAYSSRAYLRDKAPELLEYADRILVQAANQAARIDQAVWQDQSMIVLAIAAARSNQFSRSVSIARRIPRAEARSEALMQLAGSLARVAATFRVQYGEAIENSWKSLRSGIETVGALPPSSAGLEDFGVTMARQNLVDELIFRIDGHNQLARAIRQVSDEVLLQLQQNETVRSDVASPLGDSRVLIGTVEELGNAADSLGRELATLRDTLSRRRNSPTSLDPGQPTTPASPPLPTLDDPQVAAVQRASEQVIDVIGRLSEPLDRASTPTYQECARSVAMIRDADPRANAAALLVDNLLAVGRFADARAATRLIPDVNRRYSTLAIIAHSQGQRGLAAEASDWIAAEVPADRQSLLYRSVEEGVISSLSRLRSRSGGGFGQGLATP